jgi:alkylhydroperoxidase family enzyme
MEGERSRESRKTMSRIPPVDNQNFPSEEDASHAIGTMRDLFRVMAHRPDIARQAQQLLTTVMRSGSVASELKELLAIRVSQVNYCQY